METHGRMSLHSVEEAVSRFSEGGADGADVLLTTTFIENGADMPNFNNIVVKNTQNISMSASFQLRGRVGRINLQSHTYLSRKDEQLSDASF